MRLRCLPCLFCPWAILALILGGGTTALADDSAPVIAGPVLQVTVGDLSSWLGAGKLLSQLKDNLSVMGTPGVEVSPLASDKYADVTIMMDHDPRGVPELVLRRGYQGAELSRYPLTPDPTGACITQMRQEQQWEAWLALHNPKPSQVQVQMRLVKAQVVSKNGHETWKADLPWNGNVLTAGDRFTVEFRNLGTKDAYVNLLSLSDGAVKSISVDSYPFHIAAGRPEQWVKLSVWDDSSEPAIFTYNNSADSPAYPDEYLKFIASAAPGGLYNTFAPGNDWMAYELMDAPISVSQARVPSWETSLDPDLSDFDLNARRHKISLFNMSRQRSAIFQSTSQPDVSSLDICEWLQSDYPNNTAVVFYAYTEPKLRVWMLNADGIQAYAQTNVKRGDLEDRIADLRGALGVNAITTARSPRLRHPHPAERGGVSRDIALANAQAALTVSLPQAVTTLDATLLPTPITDALATVKHLIVVPTLDIGTVPFAILRPFGGQDQVVDRMSVSIAPSLYDLNDDVPQWLKAPGRQWSPKAALIVGDPDLSHDPEYIYPPLPGAENEAKAVAAAVDCPAPDLLLGPRATLSSVLSLAPKADLLYFATHGVADSSDPLTGNFLAFTPSPGNTGRLTQNYVDKHRILGAAQLAVLSACQTGLGMEHDAGMISIARGFQIAGVPRVVMSLWSVHDQATADLMEAFVRHLKTEVPAEALRDAMLETRKIYPDPADWASFVLFGTPR